MLRDGKGSVFLDLSGGGQSYTSSEDMPFSGLFHGDGEWADEMAEKTAALPDEEKSWPDSFSKIRDLDMDDAELKEKFPLFPGTASAVEINVSDGASFNTLSKLCQAWGVPFCSIVRSKLCSS